MADVDITVGVDTSAAQAGLASLRNSAASVGSAISSAFSSSIFGPVALTAALTAGVKTILEYGDKIGSLAARFSDTKEGQDALIISLQQFGNMAERNGASIETVARAFNKLDVALSQARAGNNEMRQSLIALNVTDWANKSLTLAEAAQKIGSSSMDAAAMVKVLGREGTTLRETLREAAAAGENFNKSLVISAENIRKIKEMKDSTEQAGQQIKVLGANAVAALSTFDTWLHKVNPLLVFMKMQAQGAADAVKNIGKNIPPPAETVDLSGLTANYDKIAAVEAKEEANRMRAMTSEERLTDLVSTRADLESRFADEIEREGNETEVALELRTQIAEATAQIEPLQEKITNDTIRWSEAAEKATAEEQDNLTVMEVRARFGDTIADALDTQLEFQRKINEAYREGNTALAETLIKQQQLSAEEQRRKNQEEINARARRGEASVSPFSFLSANQLAGMAAAGLSMGFTAAGAFGGDVEAFRRFQARLTLESITGINQIGFIERANLQAKQDAYDRQVGLTASAQAAFAASQRVAYFTAIAGGLTPSPMTIFNPFASLMAGTTPTGTLTTQTTTSQLQQLIQLMQTQTTTLNKIQTNLTPEPGF